MFRLLGFLSLLLMAAACVPQSTVRCYPTGPTAEQLEQWERDKWLAQREAAREELLAWWTSLTNREQVGELKRIREVQLDQAVAARAAAAEAQPASCARCCPAAGGESDADLASVVADPSVRAASGP